MDAMSARESTAVVPDPSTVLQAMTGHAVVAVDAAGLIVYWGDGAQRLHGLPAERIAGLATVDELFSPPLDATDGDRGLLDQLGRAAEPAGWAGEMRCRDASGTWFTTDLVATPYPLGSETPAGMVLVYRPASARPAPTRPGASAGPTGGAPGPPLPAPAAVQPGADVLSKLGHELRSPLTGIIGLTRILLMKLTAGPVDPAQQKRQLEMIQASAGQSLTTVERVVDIAKIESGRVGCDSRPVDCRHVVAEVAASFQTIADERGLRLRTDLPDQPVVIKTDAGILGRVLRELLDNAVKFADAGDVLVQINTDDDRRVMIDVSDHGPGIPAGDQTRIFAAFERGELASERDDGGSGLGLHLARKLADLLGAHLSVHSRTGQQTTFTITFPGPHD